MASIVIDCNSLSILVFFLNEALMFVCHVDHVNLICFQLRDCHLDVGVGRLFINDDRDSR